VVARVVSLDAAMVGWTVVAGLFMLGALGLAYAVVRSARRRYTEDETPP
jgi:hypothetical protein